MLFIASSIVLKSTIVLLKHQIPFVNATVEYFYAIHNIFILEKQTTVTLSCTNIRHVVNYLIVGFSPTQKGEIHQPQISLFSKNSAFIFTTGCESCFGTLLPSASACSCKQTELLLLRSHGGVHTVLVHTCRHGQVQPFGAGPLAGGWAVSLFPPATGGCRLAA